MCDTEKMEADMAVEAYLFHWEKVYGKVVDAKCKEMLAVNPETLEVVIYPHYQRPT